METLGKIGIKKLNHLIKKYNISLIILFGSQIKESRGINSDIDIGIYLKNLINDKEEFQLLTDLVNIFKNDSLDVAILNYASPLLLFEVAKKGKLIAERKKGDFLKFKIMAFKKYWETRKFRALRETFLNNIISRN
ncbi:MAG: hypothetical protein A2042_05295 [Candidatus Schekmanbacteria bacterium GWA2_38_11]|uniref:Polymerase beta nucleotidyltransferase domain-containing protein n=1 Tax=Candidatus Schekmanbacteria bacterium GWA2_38_11 TaxID=1817876 RepID=A0A1F7RG93_9BACT|nr:MAG: hypothetical protein A2042_05295 [Candidatus Schekmanbacteria bacterium GWA2_38_11]